MSGTDWTMQTSTSTSASIFAGSGGISVCKPTPMPCRRGWNKPGAIRRQAREAMREAERLIGEHPHSPHWSIQVKSDLARVWLAQGNLERPSQHIQKRGLQIKDEIPYQRETEYDHPAASCSWPEAIMRQPSTCPTGCFNKQRTTGQMGLVIEVLILQSAGSSGKERDRASPGSFGKSPHPGPAGRVRAILPG